jgi:hypothetical protein
MPCVDGAFVGIPKIEHYIQENLEKPQIRIQLETINFTIKVSMAFRETIHKKKYFKNVYIKNVYIISSVHVIYTITESIK